MDGEPYADLLTADEPVTPGGETAWASDICNMERLKCSKREQYLRRIGSVRAPASPESGHDF